MKASFVMRIIPDSNMVAVTCPRCGKTRQVSKAHVRRETMKKRFDGTCPSCMHIKRSKNLKSQMQRSIENKKVTEVKTACGIMVQVKSEMGGRCDPYDTCAHYWDCLSEAARLDWKGWKVCRNPL